MNITRLFIENFAHPDGLIGRIVAWRLDISNRQANEWTLSLLNLQPSDHVLEIGFGSGRTMQIAAGKVAQGYISGVDSSPSMLRLAQNRNMKLINQGRLELKLGEIEHLPYDDHSFDKVYAVQVINYLPDPRVGLKEVHRVTQPGGRVALFFEAKEKFKDIQSIIDGVYRPYAGDEVLVMLQEAGFARTWLEAREFITRSIRYRGYVALGEKEPI